MSTQKFLQYGNSPLFQIRKLVWKSNTIICKLNRNPVNRYKVSYSTLLSKYHPGCGSHSKIILRSCSSSNDKGSRFGREELHHAYHALLKRLTDLEDATRFYGYSAIRVGIFLASLIGISLYVFRDYIRENVAGEVSTVATKSLGDEELMSKAQELAVALLYTIFNDVNMQEQTVKFLQDILHKPTTQKALIDLMVMVFSEEHTQQNLTWLLKNVLVQCLDDENFRKYLSEKLMFLLTDENTKKGLKDVLNSVLNDQQVIDSGQSFVKEIVASKRVQIEATQLGKSVVEGVVNDNTVQKQTGDALWSALGYSVTPRWFVKENAVKNIEDNPSKSTADQTKK